MYHVSLCCFYVSLSDKSGAIKDLSLNTIVLKTTSKPAQKITILERDTRYTITENEVQNIGSMKLINMYLGFFRSINEVYNEIRSFNGTANGDDHSAILFFDESIVQQKHGTKECN